MRRLTESDWIRLREAVWRDLPFPPPFQRKDRQAALPEPAEFETDVTYLGDWDEGLDPLDTLEWIRVRPRRLRSRARLVAPETLDCEAEFLALLDRERIAWTRRGDCIWIFADPDTGAFSPPQTGS